MSRFISSREVVVHKVSNAQAKALEGRGGTRWKPSVLGIPDEIGYNIGRDKSLNLMDFQVLSILL